MAAGSEKTPVGPLFFADHIEARQMGEHVRELRFPEPFLLEGVRVLSRGQKPTPSSAFEGKTFPDVRTMSLSIFAADRLSTSSTMTKLRPGDGPGGFVAPVDRFITSSLVIRGEYMKLSVAIYGQKVPAGEAMAQNPNMAMVAPHLRPSAPFEDTRLDLADYENTAGGEGKDLYGPLAAATVEIANEALNDAGCPSSLTRALALGTLQDSNTRIAEHADWVGNLHQERGVLEADIIVTRLEALVRDIGQLAQKMPGDANAAHVSYGPVLARALLSLISRCMERLEFRPLNVALRALAASLCAVPTAVEVLKRSGMMQLLAVVQDSEWVQMDIKLAALEALHQLCSHSIGMEALLGWTHTADPIKPSGTGYESILALAVDGAVGCARLESAAISLLRRGGVYLALAKFDASCGRLSDIEESDATAGAANPIDGAAENGSNEAFQDALKALTQVASQFEELMLLPEAANASSEPQSLLAKDCPRAFVDTDGLCGLVGASAHDPFAASNPKMHGYLVSFASGRRLLPSLCTFARWLPRLSHQERLTAFKPLRRLLCAILASLGGSEYLASEMQTLNTLLATLESCSAAAKGDKSKAKEVFSIPAVPRFPEPLVRAAVGAPELAALVHTHVRATRLTLLLVARTRVQGRNGMLQEDEALSFLASLHELCVQGAAGRNSVVCAFRSEFLVEWLLHQLEVKFEEALRAAGGGSAAAHTLPTVRHLVAILYTIVLGDPSACVAERFGGRVLALVSKGLDVFEAAAAAAECGEGGGSGRPHGASIEFALDSEGPEGGLGRAVRLGRRSADTACLRQLREISAQLRPWQSDGDQGTHNNNVGVRNDALPVTRIMACLDVPSVPRILKRSTNEERVTRLSLALGGYCGIGASGIEVPEVDYGVSADVPTGDLLEASAEDRERYPPYDPAQLPLLSMRLLCRRAARGAMDAFGIVIRDSRKQGSEDGAVKDGISTLIPVLIRCVGALNLNLDALTLKLKDESSSVDSIYATRYAHGQLLEATLQTTYHLLKGLQKCGLPQYRHTELQHALFLVMDRLGSSLVGMNPVLAGSNPEFRLLWRHCLAWACKVFHVWVQDFAEVAGGQLLQPLIRHSRVLPWHYMPGLLLLATCGDLEMLLPKGSHEFEVVSGKSVDDVAGEQCLQSRQFPHPASTREFGLGTFVLKATPDKDAAAKQGGGNRQCKWGQFWGADCEAQDWDDIHEADAKDTNAMQDALSRALAQKSQTSGVATALDLVARVNRRRERMRLDDVGELCSLIAQCAMTSDALLHVATAEVMEKLTCIGIPVLGMVLKLAEATLKGSTSGGGDGLDSELATDDVKTLVGLDGEGNGAPRDPGDCRATARVLMLLSNFGEISPNARQALVDHKAEALCQSVLAHNPAALQPMSVTHAIRILSLMYCSGSEDDGFVGKAEAPSVPKFRMISKALSLLVNRTAKEGNVAGPVTMTAALDLLLRLNHARSMCLNLLFSASDDSIAEDMPVGSPVSVTVSCAFRLANCAQRIASELSTSDERWQATPRASEGETEAEEILSSWLHLGELLVNLCQQVLVNCPTASVFLAVVLPGGLPADGVIDESMLKGILSDLQDVLGRITNRTQRGETVPLRAANLLGNLRALQMALVMTASGPPPSTLTKEELCPPKQTFGGKRASESKGKQDEVLEKIVSLLDAAAELEVDPDWRLVADLESADGPEAMDWEFDGADHRKKRKEAIEKAEYDRKAKRMKQLARVDDRTLTRRRSSDMDLNRDSKTSRKTSSGPTVSTPAERPAAASSPPGGSPTTSATTAAKEAAKETTTAIVPVAPEPNGNGIGQSAGKVNPAEALQVFLKDHPEFMRVLQNPKKCLSDPRVKSMFLSELQNYPAVKSFLEAKGLVQG